MLKRALNASCALALLLAPAAAVIAQPAPNDATTVSDVQVTAPEQVPVPNVGIGAPLFTVPELEAIKQQSREDAQDAMSDARRCDQKYGQRYIGNFLQEYDAATLIRGSADEAVTVTSVADQVRREAARGLRTQKEVEAAELARQAAVRRMIAARAAFHEAQAVTADLQAIEAARPKPPCRMPGGLRNRNKATRVLPPCTDITIVDPTMYPSAEEWAKQNQSYILGRAQDRQYVAGLRVRPLSRQFADLALEGLTVREREDRRGRFLLISGAIRNPRATAIPTPPLSVTVLDRFGFPLRSELADPRAGPRIRAGQAIPFTYEVRPTPGGTDTLLVTFGSDEYEPPRLPAGALEYCTELPFDVPKPREGVLPSPLDPGPAALRPQRARP